MTIAQFRVFTAVVETKSFTRAAEILHITQSAASHAVAGLEEELEVALLIRDREQGISVSEFGNRVLQPILSILNGVSAIEQEAAAQKGMESGTVRVGCFPSAAARILPKIIARFGKLYPHRQILLFEGTDQEVAEWLHSRAIDVGFVGSSTLKDDIVPITRDKMVVILPKDHRLQATKNLTIASLVHFPFIMSKGGCEPLIAEMFSKHNRSPSVRFEVRDMATILNMVQEGLGITIVPEMALPDQLPKVTVRELNPIAWRNIGLCCPFSRETTPAVLAFVAVSQSIFPP
jgi:DNA-binding transcriptional LysR family regulator